MEVRSRRRVAQRVGATVWALAAGLTLSIWLLSFAGYTSIGVDAERETMDNIQVRYYRMRWPGDGSLWVGGGMFTRPFAQGTLEPLDLGAVWFQPPRPARPHSLWNRLGFWWVWSKDEGWLGVPGWFVPAVVGVLGLPTRRRSALRGMCEGPRDKEVQQ